MMLLRIRSVKSTKMLRLSKLILLRLIKYLILQLPLIMQLILQLPMTKRKKKRKSHRLKRILTK